MAYITDSKRKGIIFLFCLLFLCICSTPVLSQVSIAPTSLFFNTQNPIASLTVSNGGEQAQEISISTQFGYPISKNGNIRIVTDSVLAEKKSIADWIKIFPKNFTLQPQQRQTVRFVVRTPQSLEPGGYWSRIKIQSNPVSPPIEAVEEGLVGAQINLVINQVISAHYITPDAQTGVTVNSVDFTQVDSTNSGRISIAMEQTGNAPFLGIVQLQVKNDSDETVFRASTTNSVYTTITRTFTMDLSDIKPGQYTITGEISSQRADINQDKLLQVTPITFSKQITIE